MPSKPVGQARLYQGVANQLREAILSGQYLPDERLPNEPELIDRFGVSRAVVRQATMNLEHEGLVTVQVGNRGGAFVQQPGVDPLLRALENLFRHRQVGLDDYLSAKALLEPVMVHAIEGFTGPEHQGRLRDNVERFRQAIEADAEPEALLRLSLEFHEILIQASGNPVLEAVLIAVVRLAERVPAFVMTEGADWAHILREHDELVRALPTRRFRRLMLHHLDSVEQIFQATPNRRAAAE